MKTGGLEESRSQNRAQTHGINDAPERVVIGGLLKKSVKEKKNEGPKCRQLEAMENLQKPMK